MAFNKFIVYLGVIIITWALLIILIKGIIEVYGWIVRG